MDAGQKATEKKLKQVEARINKEYQQAIEEIEDELTDYLSRFEKKDETWRKWVAEGKKTQKEYEQWRLGQMAVGKRWNDQKEIIAHQLFEVSEDAKNKIKSICPEVYRDNYNYSIEQVANDVQIVTSFDLYSKEAVERLIEEDPEVLPPVGKKVAKQIAEGKAVRWNRQQLQSVMIQGIMQGDSIPKLATRLATTVGDRDRKASIRNARTMATGAQNAGRVAAYKRAQDKGVDLVQMWIATMDNRTRHSHRWLDGETRPVGEAFSNGCEYPADPKGDPAEIYNCRCTLRGVVKGLERRSGQYRDTSAINGMSRDEWLNGDSESNSITLPEEKAKAIKQSKTNEYKYGPKNENGEMNRVEYVPTKEYKSTAQEFNQLLDTYGLKESKWNGDIYVNSNYATNTAQIDDNLGIAIAQKSSQGTIIHELLHGRSYAYDTDAYEDFRNIEEATVQMLTEEICKEHNFAFAYTYQELVEPLRQIREVIPQYDSDLEFAKDLINQRMTTRYGWLYNKVDKEQMTEEIEKAFDKLSGGDLGL